jgi:RNA polymerase sigma factor (sigma-70 family)
MADGLLGRLRRFPAPDLAAEPDAALLDRFAAGPDDAPFAELVRRHGPMVLGVCRRVLGCHADAEDAFQAAFLVLARKAAAVRGRPVGGWLCRVAGNVARRHRDQARRRARHEHAAAARFVSHAPAPTVDLAAVIDDELGRLPDRERAAVVTCLLGGRTQEEAARELGWSFGTLRRRLDRGKELLRVRLTRCGVTVPAGFAGITFVESVPPVLADLTRVGAVGFARGVKTATPAVSLAEGVLAMMSRTKLAAVTGAVVAAAALTVGTGWALQPDGRPSGLPKVQPPAPGVRAGAPPGAPVPGIGAGDNLRLDVPPLGDHRIKAGDRLFIRGRLVFDSDPIDGIYVVEPSGKVAIGPAYGGRIVVAGKTYEEAEAAIQRQVLLYARSATIQVTAADTARADALEERVRRLEEEVARLKAAVGTPRP